MPKAKKMTNAEFWKIVKEISWDKYPDFDSRKLMLKGKYPLEVMDSFRDKYHEMAKLLEDAIDAYSSNKSRSNLGNALALRNLSMFPYGGDDSFSDMLGQVIGRGKAYFDRVRKNPAILTKLSYDDIYEAFIYCIPFPEDYPKKSSRKKKAVPHMVTIHLEFESKPSKRDVYEYLKDLIDDDSLGYEAEPR